MASAKTASIRRSRPLTIVEGAGTEPSASWPVMQRYSIAARAKLSLWGLGAAPISSSGAAKPWFSRTIAGRAHETKRQEPEPAQLGPGLGDERVAGMQVAVDELTLMGEADHLHQRPDQLEGPVDAERLGGLGQQARQRHALFGGEDHSKGPTFGDAPEHAHEPWVVELRRATRPRARTVHARPS